MSIGVTWRDNIYDQIHNFQIELVSPYPNSYASNNV